MLEAKNAVFMIGERKDVVLKTVARIRMKKGFQSLLVLTHQPSIRRDPAFYDPVIAELRLHEASSLSSKLQYRRLKAKTLTVLVLDSEYFLIRECVKTLEKLGHKVVTVPVKKDGVVETMLVRVATEKPDFLLSVNHLGFDQEGKLAELLEAMRLPFAVWYVDSPTFIIKTSKSNVSSYCAMFVWDRGYLEPMRGCGFERVYHLPLATDPSVFRPMPKSQIPATFRGGVSFVGNSMVEAVEDWFCRFPRDWKTDAIGRLAVRFQIEDHRLLMEEILEAVAEKHGLRSRFEDPVHDLSFQAALVWQATLEYRKSLVEALESLDIRIYGDPGWHRILDGRVKILPAVNYYRDLPRVFNGTCVNVNATSFQMSSTVNQRVFDTASCGAFLITDHQPEIEMLFDREREIVCYENFSQARDQVAYYLKNGSERRHIARQARRRVLADHTYSHRLEVMISVMREEFGSV
jgi:spore maturation protein CgeB